MIDSVNFGNLVRNLRLAKGFTEAELAARATTPETPISEGYIKLIEANGRDRPTATTVTAILRALGQSSEIYREGAHRGTGR